MKRIGFKTTADLEKEKDEISCLDFMNNQTGKVVLQNIENEIARIILEYSDSKIYPMRVGEERDKWFLEQIRKIRIKYMEEI